MRNVILTNTQINNIQSKANFAPLFHATQILCYQGWDSVNRNKYKISRFHTKTSLLLD